MSFFTRGKRSSTSALACDANHLAGGHKIVLEGMNDCCSAKQIPHEILHLKSFQSSATLQLHATLPVHAVLCAMDVLWLLWLRYMRYAAGGLVDDIGITVRICQELLDGLFGLEHSWSTAGAQLEWYSTV
jgi:hypothetical protein